MVPKEAHALIPGNYEYITLQEKREFADVSKVTNLQIRSGLSEWAQ